MEQTIQSITEFFNSPEMITILTSFFSFLAANLMTIILFSIKMVKIKSKEIKDRAINDKLIADMKKSYEDQINKLYSQINEKLSDVELTVIGRVKELDEEKQKMIESQTVQLEKAVEETKKSLSIDDILDD